MAAHWYPAGIAAVMNGSVDLDGADIRAVLVTSGYAFNVAHDFLDDVGAGFRVGTPVALAGKAIIVNGNNRALDATDTTWVALSGSAANAVVLYVFNASEPAAQLLGYLDGFTVTPNGDDVTLRWNASGLLEVQYS